MLNFVSYKINSKSSILIHYIVILTSHRVLLNLVSIRSPTLNALHIRRMSCRPLHLSRVIIPLILYCYVAAGALFCRCSRVVGALFWACTALWGAIALHYPYYRLLNMPKNTVWLNLYRSHTRVKKKFVAIREESKLINMSTWKFFDANKQHFVGNMH